MVAQNGYGPARGRLDEPAIRMTTAQQPDPFGATVPVKGPSGPRAGFWVRFGAFFLDGMLLLVPYVVAVAGADKGTAVDVWMLASVLYFTLLEGGARGRTLGKRVFRIRVIDHATGGPIGYGRAFIRWIGLWVSFLPFLLGFLWMLWDPEKQTWHDRMSHSVVVPTRVYPVA
jgi:uncharacterized RDD family membrane protein YckC